VNRESAHPQDETGMHAELAQAVSLHGAGRLHEAAEIYERISARYPRQFDALHLLGVIALQEGRFAEAQQKSRPLSKLNLKTSRRSAILLLPICAADNSNRH